MLWTGRVWLDFRPGGSGSSKVEWIMWSGGSLHWRIDLLPSPCIPSGMQSHVPLIPRGRWGRWVGGMIFSPYLLSASQRRPQLLRLTHQCLVHELKRRHPLPQTLSPLEAVPPPNLGSSSLPGFIQTLYHSPRHTSLESVKMGLCHGSNLMICRCSPWLGSQHCVAYCVVSVLVCIRVFLDIL